MKKYYCPYCGERSLRVGQKINIGKTAANAHLKCRNCGDRVYLRRHWIVRVFFICMSVALICALVFASYVFLALFILLHISYDILSVLFSKFVKGDISKEPQRQHTCLFEVSPCLIHPQMFFGGNSVLEVEYEGNRYPVNVALENENRIIFSFINLQDEMELLNGTVSFYDGEKMIGTGKIG